MFSFGIVFSLSGPIAQDTPLFHIYVCMVLLVGCLIPQQSILFQLLYKCILTSAVAFNILREPISHSIFNSPYSKAMSGCLRRKLPYCYVPSNIFVTALLRKYESGVSCYGRLCGNISALQYQTHPYTHTQIATNSWLCLSTKLIFVTTGHYINDWFSVLTP